MIAEINAGGHGWTAGVNERFKGYTLVRGGGGYGIPSLDVDV